MTNDEWRMTITAAEIHRETGHRMFSNSRICEKPMAKSKPITNDDEDRCLFPLATGSHGYADALSHRIRIVICLRCAIDVSQSLGCHSGFVILPIAPSD
jgi:hypothetical protein